MATALSTVDAAGVAPSGVPRRRLFTFYTQSPKMHNLYKSPGVRPAIFPVVGETMEPARPLDTLNRARGKRVIVELKNQKQFVGTLVAFDIHINVVLDEAEERDAGELKRKLGTVFLRGDTITIISPTQQH